MTQKPRCPWLHGLRQGCKDHAVEKELLLQQRVLGKLDIHTKRTLHHYLTLLKKSVPVLPDEKVLERDL